MLERIQQLDAEILKVTSATLEDQDCMREAEEASKFMEELDDVLYDIGLKLEQRLSPADSVDSVASSSASAKAVRAKLPKLELQKLDVCMYVCILSLT